MTDVAQATRKSGLHPALIATALVAGALVAATVALWAHYGSTVFYEMILAGIALCL